MMEVIHDFLDRGVEVPEMNVEDVNVRCAEFLQTCFDAELETFSVVANIVGLDLDILVMSFEKSSVLWA